jgi:hypothetical protein
MNRQEPLSQDSTTRLGRVVTPIDPAAAILADPRATPPEVVAAHSFLREALALDGRLNTCGAESIDTVREESTLPRKTRSGFR